MPFMVAVLAFVAAVTPFVVGVDAIYGCNTAIFDIAVLMLVLGWGSGW